MFEGRSFPYNQQCNVLVGRSLRFKPMFVSDEYALREGLTIRDDVPVTLAWYTAIRGLVKEIGRILISANEVSELPLKPTERLLSMCPGVEVSKC